MVDLHPASTRPCPACGQPQRVIPLPWRGGSRYLWRPCPCREGAIDASEARELARSTSLVKAYAHTDAADDLEALAAQSLTLDRFQRDLLQQGASGEHPLDAAIRWLDEISGAERAILADDEQPAAMLYLTSPTRGCGKTHLAAGIALAARAAGRRVALVEEKRLLAAYWGATLEGQEQLLARYGEQAWLLVLDDLGRRPARRVAEGETTAAADVWDALLNRRYARGGWTVITSNLTPGELLDQGIVTLSTFSRISQMTRRRLVCFYGEDRRLARLPESSPATPGA